MTDANNLPRAKLLIVALAQSLALLLLYRSVDNGWWPTEAPVWATMLWTLAIIVPLLFLLSLENKPQPKLWLWLGAYSVVLIIVSAYVGYQAEPFGEFRIGSMMSTFTVTITIASFKVLMYMQQRASGASLTYHALFSYSWRNFLTSGLAAAFVLAFFLVLMLWAELFKAIDIEFFRKLFWMDWFIFPALGIAFGLGISIFRNLVSVIDAITRLARGLISLLLPLVLLVFVTFLGALPFVGLESLWATRSGTTLLLMLLAAILFFTNAVYQDGRGETPYPLIVHRLIYLAMMLTPVLAVLSFYGLYLRVAQYGWTVERSWAFVVWLLLSLVAIGYAVGIIRRRDQWTHELYRVNIRIGLVVIAITLLANSPLLDFRKLAVSSQMARLEAGETSLEQFDFWYFRHHLARPGYLAVEKIKANTSDEKTLAMIESAEKHYYGVAPSAREPIWEVLQRRPADLEIPDALREKIESNLQLRFVQNATPYIFKRDLDADGVDEYIVLLGNQRYVHSAFVYEQTKEGWASHSASVQYGASNRGDITSILANGSLSTATRRFDSLRIGEIVISVDAGDWREEPVQSGDQ